MAPGKSNVFNDDSDIGVEAEAVSSRRGGGSGASE